MHVVEKKCIVWNKIVIQAMFIWKKRMYLLEQDGNTGDVYMEEKNVSFGTRW
jgi:hypothetical protein